VDLQPMRVKIVVQHNKHTEYSMISKPVEPSLMRAIVLRLLSDKSLAIIGGQGSPVSKGAS
jgi:hypothetical protein